MPESKGNPVNRRDALGILAGFAAGGLTGFSLGKNSEPLPVQTPPKETPFRASVSQRDNLPARVRQELYVQDPNLEKLVEQDKFITQLIDMPTDWVSLYVEKMRDSGHPIPDNVQTEIRAIFETTSKQIDEALGKVK